MKIPLNMGQDLAPSSRAAQTKALENDIIAAKKGDWNAKRNIVRSFMPLLTSLAEKRSSDTKQTNNLIEAGKEGLFKAVKKFNIKNGADKFRLFALDFIEKSMDSGSGFLASLFGKKS